MAVPAFRQSPGRTRRRRAHDALTKTNTVSCPSCGGWKRPHTSCRSCGYVRPGLQVKATRPEA
ncbi:MAG: 50S ribosomal protein L32 [Planctomycetota bacterium]|nr:50S ribosomal protein L32 [Planctomycetota bacterium]MEC8558836.1 50S ribosomal protein L32 [Planctomycetota bacterium]MEC8734325.1 50S ribosomal protein L32 [Planctomycetota bacterium]MEC9157866.1 50S ribosomal protein L32 [Planctomycetota bacterium]MED6306481.1 50S ribosomal protein L32 [Planctomycetota bacterium]